MKYSLNCYIRTNNDGIRNAVKQLIPDINNPLVWDGEYDFNEFVDEDEISVFNCSVRFHTKADRDDITASVKGLAGVINACEGGSFVREYKTWHDEAVDGSPPRPCEEETILRKN